MSTLVSSYLAAEKFSWSAYAIMVGSRSKNLGICPSEKYLIIGHDSNLRLPTFEICPLKKNHTDPSQLAVSPLESRKI